VTYHLGIDVGAARTSAAIAREGTDDAEPVDLGDGGCGVASVLHLGADGSLDVGEAAERWADDEPDRVVRGFPGRIGDDVPMLLAGEPWAPEELTAWLVRWVVDKVAEGEGGAAEAVAVTRPASWEADRTELLAGALAEQDVDATFLTTARAAEWYPAESGPDGASAAACGAALALRAGSDDVAARLAALARFPDVPARPPADGDPDDGPSLPAPRTHRSGGWGAAERIEGTDDSGGHRATRPTGTDDGDDALIAALGGFTGTLGATNTAGLLSGYTPPSGLAASGQATALVVDAGELALPTQRSGSGRWAAVAEAADEELEPEAAPTRRPERNPVALVSIGGAAAAVAVIATLFLWPAPRTTNSAISRPIPLVPAVTSPTAPTAELTPTATATPTTTRPRPAPARARRPVPPPPAVETTPAPSESTEPTEPSASSSAPPSSESTAPPTTTEQPDDD
jgi:hypothetical protein